MNDAGFQLPSGLLFPTPSGSGNVRGGSTSYRGDAEESGGLARLQAQLDCESFGRRALSAASSDGSQLSLDNSAASDAAAVDGARPSPSPASFSSGDRKLKPNEVIALQEVGTCSTHRRSAAQRLCFSIGARGASVVHLSW